MSLSPSSTKPRALKVARFAELPVPQGERSTRPGQRGAGLVGVLVQSIAEHHIGHLFKLFEQRVTDLHLFIDQAFQTYTLGRQFAGILGGRWSNRLDQRPPVRNTHRRTRYLL